MIIPEEVFETFSHSYKKVIEELKNKIAESEDDKQKNELIISFSKKYLTPWQYIKYCEDVHLKQEYLDMCSLEHYENGPDGSAPKSFGIENFILHFYHNEFDVWSPGQLIIGLTKLLKYNFGFKSNFIKEHDLSYPHSALTKCWQDLENTSSGRLPPQLFVKYKKMKNLYNQICKVKDNVEEWFKMVCKTGDDFFIRHNVMYRIGKNLCDKKLWNLYIDYLREVDPSEMLQVYSRYCRFFLDDLEKKEKYKNEVEKFGPVFVSWENVFKFEEKCKNDGSESRVLNVKSNVESLLNGVDTALITHGTYDQSQICNFFKNVYNQNFPFRSSFMSYILKHANASVLSYLQRTCKYFFITKPTPLCHKLKYVSEETHFENESFFINENIEVNQFPRIHLTTTLQITSLFLPETFISGIIPRLYKCDAKYIFIEYQDLTIDELKFLVGHGNVINLSLSNVEVRHHDDEIVSVESITQFLPNIETLCIGPARVNRTTATALLGQKFISKISSFILYEIIGDLFNCEDFIKFCKKIQDKRFWLALCFKNVFLNEQMIPFFNLLKEYTHEKKHIGFSLNGRTKDRENF